MQLDHKDYTVAWISALPCELAAAVALLDVEHDKLSSEYGDHNTYTLGSIGSHNIVIAPLPDGTYGTTSAAIVSAFLLRSFPNIKFCLMVGVGGGIPNGGEIRLGDVVVSRPDGRYGGVVQYDFGTSTHGGNFVVKGALNKPPLVLATAVTKMRASEEQEGPIFKLHFQKMLTDNPNMTQRFSRPFKDLLFNSNYCHVREEPDCKRCASEKLVQRQPRNIQNEVQVHYGLIGSANQVVRDANLRDKLGQELGVKCLEMEAAGLMDASPCLVIRGICDYADTHKNKEWQPYASAMAGAYAKQLLLLIPAHRVNDTERMGSALQLRENVLGVEQDQFYTLKEKDLECLRDLRQTDPRDDKSRIEESKGGLLEDVYVWILKNEKFKHWKEKQDGGFLWISGDPGKGKTMLLCGLLRELKDEFIAYFFFQEGDNRLNSAVAGLRGIIFMLISQRPGLIKHVKQRYSEAGKALFEDSNGWFALSHILRNMLQDRLVLGVSIVLDALDECTNGQHGLLELIADLSKHVGVKWIVSSRNSSDIEERLRPVRDSIHLSLEQNPEEITHAVSMYIHHKVDRLSQRKLYSEETKNQVTNFLVCNADATFLWVSLVCLRLEDVKARDTVTALTVLPYGLQTLYERMLATIKESENSSLLFNILALVSITYRPLDLLELAKLLNLPPRLIQNLRWISELIHECASFLTIRYELVYFVHASAKDFLQDHGNNLIYPRGVGNAHYVLYHRSLSLVSTALRQDIYSTKKPGIFVEEIFPPKHLPLSGVEYPCVHWLDHVFDVLRSDSWQTSDDKRLYEFLRTSYVYWLEAISILGYMAAAIITMKDLHTSLQSFRRSQDNSTISPELLDFVYDAYRFVSAFGHVIGSYPLQVYTSVLIFSPATSLVRKASIRNWPGWLRQMTGPAVDDWSCRLRTFASDKGFRINSIAFSPTGNTLATGSHNSIQIWHIDSGTILFETRDITGPVRHVVYSLNGKFLLSSSTDGSIAVWNASLVLDKMLVQQTNPKFPFLKSCPIAMMPVTGLLVSGHEEGYVKIWNLEEYACVHHKKIADKAIDGLCPSKSGTWILFSSGNTCTSLDLESWSTRIIVSFGDSSLSSMKLSPDEKHLMITSFEAAALVELNTGSIRKVWSSDLENVSSAFGPQDNMVSIACGSKLRVFDLNSIEDIMSFTIPHDTTAIEFTLDRGYITSLSYNLVHLWDVLLVNKHSKQSIGEISGLAGQDIRKLRFSPDGAKIWIVSHDNCLQVCETANMAQPIVSRSVLKGSRWSVPRCDYFGNETIAIVRCEAFGRSIIELWQISSIPGQLVWSESIDAPISYLKFSPDGNTIIACSHIGNLYLLNSGGRKTRLIAKIERPDSGSGFFIEACFYPDGSRFVLVDTGRIEIWDLGSRSLVRSVNMDSIPHALSISPIHPEVAIAHGAYLSIYDLNTLTEKGGVESFMPSSQLKYDPSGQFLTASYARWRIDREGDDSVKIVWDTSNYLYMDDSWICFGDEKLIWIPPEYRGAVDVCGNNVALGHTDEARVTILDIGWQLKSRRGHWNL